MDSRQFGGNIPLRPSQRGAYTRKSYNKRYTVGLVPSFVLFLLSLTFSVWVVYFWICVAGYVNAWPF